MEDGRIPAQERLHTQPGSVKTVADILTAAADLIEPEGRWTQGRFSRDADGNADRSRWSTAPVCWCAIGAIAEVSGLGVDAAVLSPAAKALEATIGTDIVAGWNDAPGRTQAEVVAALRAAADKARTAPETGAVGMEPQSGGMHP